MKRLFEFKSNPVIQTCNFGYYKTANHPWAHHSRAHTDHLYVPRKQGRRGLMQLEETYIAEIIKLQVYIDSKKNPLMQNVRLHQHTTNSAMLHTARSLKRELQRGTRQIKDSTANTKEGWLGKRMHVQFPQI